VCLRELSAKIKEIALMIYQFILEYLLLRLLQLHEKDHRGYAFVGRFERILFDANWLFNNQLYSYVKHC
jgi:hypothetical protein